MRLGQIIKGNRFSLDLKHKIAWITVVGIAFLGIIGGVSFAAANPEVQPETYPDAAGYYTKDGKIIPIIPGGDITVTKLGNLTPGQLETLYPMSREDEAKIIHVLPSCPVIIDGIQYKPEEIHLFDGIRLRFVVGKDGNLYAFTKVEDFEQFQAENQPDTLKGSSTVSAYYMDMWYTGDSFGLPPGNGIPYLYEFGFDNAVSSVKATLSAAWTYIYDYVEYLGDYFAMAGGTDYGMLFFQGWNDRASSAYVSAY